MDMFDQYLFRELEKMYARTSLTAEEQRELFIRFGNLEHLEEVQPYLFAMRWFGWGVEAQREEVLQELKKLIQLMPEEQILKGLHEDLILCSGKGTALNREKLKDAIAGGYTGVYLKDKTAVTALTSKTASPAAKPQTPPAAKTVAVPPVQVKKIEFESKGVIRREFNTNDVDYLCAKVHVVPADVPRKIKVTSQIFNSSGKAQSREIVDEFTLNPGSTWFKTTGWGSKNVGNYPADTYRWVLKISDSDKNWDGSFTIFRAEEFGEVQVNRVVLFASRLNDPPRADTERYSTSFRAKDLECVYVKALIREPGRDLKVNAYLKIENTDNGVVIYEGRYVHQVQHNYVSIWKGAGYDTRGKWKAGNYRYTFHLGSSKFHGTFTVS